MVAFLGTIRPVPYSLRSFANQRLQLSLSRFPISVSRHGFSFSSPKRSIQASLPSESARNSTVAASTGEQSEIIFMGTGTSEGIPRLSCLTNPSQKCSVCRKATEPGSKNRRLNTSILVRFPGSAGMRNVLIDAGKFFYHSALRWFPTYGS